MFEQINQPAAVKGWPPCLWCDAGDTCFDLNCVFCDGGSDDKHNPTPNP
ncbi:MAG: hypothetical protein RR448_01085 [Niameybacter sp.]